jgi:hypothetical protein
MAPMAWACPRRGFAFRRSAVNESSAGPRIIGWHRSRQLVVLPECWRRGGANVSILMCGLMSLKRSSVRQP